MSKKLYEKMNLYLANQEVAYIKLHNLHWYVKGRSFFTLHAKLEELYPGEFEVSRYATAKGFRILRAHRHGA